MNKKIIEKYINNYSESDIEIVNLLNDSWDFCISIPCRNEYRNIIELLETSKNLVKKKTLFILVVNASLNSNKEVLENNNLLLSFFDCLNKKFNLKKLSDKSSILIVNRSFESYLFSEKQGVGLARKIGVDIFVSLYHQKKVISNWVCCTDADVNLPEDYFSEIKENDYSALIYPFYHKLIYSEGDLKNKAMQLYEIYLRYYYLGLKYAKSPYAFYTIGSTIFIDVESYAHVRGFPRKKNAAEDFYILNKLSKIKPIKQLNGNPILINGRESDRVPFGTGKSVITINKLLKEGEQYKVYDPKVFDYLKRALELFEKFSFRKDITSFFKFENIFDEVVLDVLKQLKIDIALKASLQNKEPKKILNNLNIWFDSLKTLRFIHLVEEKCFPKLPWDTSLKKASFIDIPSDFINDDKIEDLRELLFSKS